MSMPHEPPATIGEAVLHATLALRDAGIDGAGRDARLLVEAAAGCSKRDLVAEPGRHLTGDAAVRLAAMLERRVACEPVSRILGTRGFYGRDFAITPDVLDPRPETETLVDAALSIAAREGWTTSPIRILDIGTGSGCLLVTLLAELPQATGLGTDVSDKALAVARTNARQHGVADRASWRQTRSLAGIDGRFDLVVSNPPYIPSDEISRLEPEVRLYDPTPSLDGGTDGLAVYREIFAGIHERIGPGWVLVEVGAGQAPSVIAAMEAALPCEKLTQPETYCDLAGHTRCVAWKALV
jgi:release factor glutamine methyltransferase